MKTLFLGWFFYIPPMVNFAIANTHLCPSCSNSSGRKKPVAMTTLVPRNSADPRQQHPPQKSISKHMRTHENTCKHIINHKLLHLCSPGSPRPPIHTITPSPSHHHHHTGAASHNYSSSQPLLHLLVISESSLVIISGNACVTMRGSALMRPSVEKQQREFK